MIPKFRVWNKKTKSFIDDCDIVLDLISSKIYAGDIGLMDSVIDVTEQIILMQSTGLKDKNDVEIFEGDILRFVEVTNEGLFEYVTDVKWEDCSFVIKSGGKYYDTFLAAWSGDPDNTYPLFEMEVIGNIWENPELLENKNEQNKN